MSAARIFRLFGDPFGKCPECHRSDGYVNVGRDHWGICDQHRTRWDLGTNLFSGWRDESPLDWERNLAQIGSYRIVEPIGYEEVLP